MQRWQGMSSTEHVPCRRLAGWLGLAPRAAHEPAPAQPLVIIRSILQNVFLVHENGERIIKVGGCVPISCSRAA